MEPLSVAASIITIVQVANAITIICLDARSKSSCARLNIRRVLDDVNSLRSVLENLARFITDGDDKPVADLPNLQALATEDGPLSRCRTELEELQVELQRAVDSKSGMITWLFREKDVSARLERVSRVKQTLQLALTTDQTTILLSSQVNSMAIQSTVDNVAADNQRESILQWLGAVSSSSAVNAAQKLRTPTTSDWFLDGSIYAQWKTSPCSLFWLHGIPGSGKTVLCSSIVEDLKELNNSISDMLVLYVFFDFSRQGPQVVGTFLRSLLAQILVQTHDIPEAIVSLFRRHHNGFNHPGDHTLLDTLHILLNDPRPTYLIIDAFDECAERVNLLGAFRNIVNWKLDHLHILATSRSELDIDETFSSLGAYRFSLEDEDIGKDIRQFVEVTLRNDNSLKKWSDEIQTEIATVILSKAGPMFRWVACQLDALRTCINLKRLREALYALPSTLDETYARILMSIDPTYTKDALRVLSFLCFSINEVTVEEIADVLAVNFETNEYDLELRVQNPADIVKICGSLVARRSTGEVSLSHYTVKEFLTSSRILHSKLSHFHIRACTAQTLIAKATIVYLMYYDQQTRHAPAKKRPEFWPPFAAYSMGSWYFHFEWAGNVAELLPLVTSLLYKEDSDFPHWGIRGDGGRWAYYPEALQLSTSNKEDIVLNIAAHLGCPELVEIALRRGADINGAPGVLGTALNTATIRGHKAVVQLLLDKGADVNFDSGLYGSALQTACCCGRVDIMSILISRGADVDRPGGSFGAPILAAFRSEYNYIEAVELLLNAGCSPYVKGTYATRHYSKSRISLLCIAAHGGFESAVRHLLERVLDPNDDKGAALQYALDEGHTEIADALIKKGADVNFSGGPFYSTIGAAVSGGIFSMQFLVRKHNADLTIRDLQGRNALQLATKAATGTPPCEVEYLIELGMDVNDKDGRGWSSIHYAVMARDTQNLKILKPHWRSDCSVPDNQWTPLHLACCFNGADALDLLTEMGYVPTTVTTTEGRWTLYDIAVVFRNERLVAQDGTPLHSLIAQTQAERSDTRTADEMRWDMPMYLSKICDGCSPFTKLPIYGPVFHCEVCPDFDYCFICMHDSHEAHPHSSWQTLVPPPTRERPPEIPSIVEETSTASEDANEPAIDKVVGEILPDRRASGL